MSTDLLHGQLVPRGGLAGRPQPTPDSVLPWVPALGRESTCLPSLRSPEFLTLRGQQAMTLASSGAGALSRVDSL